jgi:hypothetical protein
MRLAGLSLNELMAASGSLAGDNTHEASSAKALVLKDGVTIAAANRSAAAIRAVKTHTLASNA